MGSGQSHAWRRCRYAPCGTTTTLGCSSQPGSTQVLGLHRILVLRDLGVPLSEVGQLIGGDVTVEQLRGILRLRQAEARARLAT